MDETADEPRSRLFMVRVWSEDVSDGRTEWRGKAQYVSGVDGEIHYFRDWTALVTWLERKLPTDGSR